MTNTTTFTSRTLAASASSDAWPMEDEANEVIPFSPRWATDAPKGGRQVLNRALGDPLQSPSS